MRYLLLFVLFLSVSTVAAQDFNVTTSAPAIGESSVALETTVSFTFSTPLDTSITFSETGDPLEFFTISPPDSIQIDSTYFSADLTQAFFDVTHTDDTDFVWILTGAMNQEGTILCAPYVLQYTTADDTGPFSVSGEVVVYVPLKRDEQDCYGLTPYAMLWNRLPEDGGHVVAATVTERKPNDYREYYDISGVREGVYWPAAVVVDEGLTYRLGSHNFYDPDRNGMPDTLVIGGNRTNIDFEISGPGAVQYPAEIAGVAALLPNYPNPFNPRTTIGFRLDRPARIELSVYDVLGRRVALLADGWLPTGYREVTWTPGTLPSGVYLLRLQAGDHTLSRTLLLAK